MGALVDLRLEAEFEAGGEQTNAAVGGVGAEFFHRGGADLAPRGIDHAKEGGVVIRVHQQPQVAHDVLYLGEREEGVAAGDGVGNALFSQRPLEHSRLVIAAIENGKVCIVGFVLEAVVEDRGGHLEGFILLVGTVDYFDGVAVAEFTP